MLGRLGNVIYWFGCLLAITCFSGVLGGDRISVAVLGAILFLVGWAARYILTGSKSIKP
jgi:hypothetical protein